MRNRPSPVGKRTSGDGWNEPDYLLGEELRPEEVRRIEERLLAYQPDVSERPTRGRWYLGAAAALLLFGFFIVIQLRSPEVIPQPPSHEPEARAASSREMRLEIVRTDLPDAKPYKLQIKLETPTSPQNEVQP